MLLGTPRGKQMGIPKLGLHFLPRPAPHPSGNCITTSKASPTYQYIEFGVRLISSVKWGHKNSSLKYTLLRNDQNLLLLQNSFILCDHFHVPITLVQFFSGIIGTQLNAQMWEHSSVSSDKCVHLVNMLIKRERIDITLENFSGLFPGQFTPHKR